MAISVSKNSRNSTADGSKAKTFSTYLLPNKLKLTPNSNFYNTKVRLKKYSQTRKYTFIIIQITKVLEILNNAYN